MSAVSSDNNVLVIKTVQIAPFRTLMTALKDILLETNITFQKDGIRIINMDKSHTILAHLHLNAENFEKYECKKDKIIVKSLPDDSDDLEIENQKSKKNKDAKKKQKSKDKKKKDKYSSKREKDEKLNTLIDTEFGLNDRLVSSNEHLSDANHIIQIMEEECLDTAFPEDSYIFFEQAIRHNLDSEISNIFRVFLKNGDSSFLLTRIESLSEEMLEAFKEKNFSNSEIGALRQLRKSRSVKYRDAFLEFKQE